MSGETDDRRSSWTVDTLHAYMDNQFSSLQAALDERYQTQTKAVDAAFRAAEAAVGKALESAEKAVGKAEIAAEKRFDAVNEFRAQLADQAGTFMPRLEAEAAIARNSERIRELTDIAAGHVTRAEWTDAHARLFEEVRAIATAQTQLRGQGIGQAATWGLILAIIAALGALVSILVTVGHL